MSSDIRTALSFDTRTVLKENEVFLVCDISGDIRAHSMEGQGLYFRDTRFLSMYQMGIEEMGLSLLSAAGDQSSWATFSSTIGAPSRMAHLEAGQSAFGGTASSAMPS